MEHLDRVYANTKWLDQYPDASIIYLPKTHSDHNPILISLKKKSMNYIDKPFRLETMWCSHPEFTFIVNKHWATNDLISATKSFEEDVKSWSNEVFGDIHRKKRQILARLSGIQISPRYSTSIFLQELEKKLQHQYNEILVLEEDYWKLRSRVMWMNGGDVNTKYFQITVTNRKRINKITFFKDDPNKWIDDPNP